MQLTTHLDLHTYACLQAHIIPTDLPRTRDPPERDTQRPAATTTAESPQIPDEEARDILAKAIRTRLMMDLALAGSNSSIQIFACLGPTTRSTAPKGI